MDLNRDSAYFLELQTKTGWGQMLASFARWCAPHPGDWVLDVGCGPGLLPVIFAQAGCHTIGADHDTAMFTDPLHDSLATADAAELPFPGNAFHLASASNLLFLAPNPGSLLREMARISQPGGRVCLLNPSEHMSEQAAAHLADQRNLEGLARETLLNYARRAETHFRWDEAATAELFRSAGLQLTESTLRMGPGLVRFAQGIKPLK